MYKVISYPFEGGVAVVHPAPAYLNEHGLDAIIAKDVPSDSARVIMDFNELPTDMRFRDSWIFDEVKGVGINMDKAKTIAHVIRREARAKEFAPYDDIIMKQIPGNDSQIAEQNRVKIREKYAEIQIAIDSCSDIESISKIIDSIQI